MSKSKVRYYWQAGLLATFTLFCAALCWNAPYPRDLWLQHAPTIPFVITTFVVIRKRQLSTLTFMMLMTFFALHAIGARYIYSYVPYDQWLMDLAGFSLSDIMGWERNHYDRLVHFSYGLLWAYPAREFLERKQLVRGWASRYFAFEFIVATGALYELGEWLVAIIFAPEWADRYLGQQGDIWDAQKDMALETCGAIIALILTSNLKSDFISLQDCSEA